MFSYKKLKMSVKKESVSNYIYNWSFGHDKVLNVISIPYNGCKIFIKALIELINNGKTILYITDEDEGEIKIIESLKKFTDFKDYSYIRRNFVEKNKKLIISSHNNADILTLKFDLVVYDDINSYPKYNKNEIIDIVLKKCSYNGKIICYSIEKIFETSKDILLPIGDAELPMIEPRVVTTKIDISKDIPYVIYEYLKWSVDINRRVAIYVPDCDKAKKVYSYLNEGYSKTIKNLIYYSCESNSTKSITKFLRAEKGVLITNEYKNSILSSKNTNIIVFFADDIKFDYKKLVNFCGRVEKGEKEGRGEVIFLVSTETKDIEKAKEVTRNFNKEAWELGLINI